MAPELLVNCLFYDAIKSDIYATGVLLYSMIYGHSPYAHPSVPDNAPFKQVLNEYYSLKCRPIELDSSIPLSPECADLIVALLNHKPEKRPSLTKIMEKVEQILQNNPTKWTSLPLSLSLISIKTRFKVNLPY